MGVSAATPAIPSLTRRLLKAARGFTTPLLLPDDYLERSTRELRAKIVRVHKETPDTATVVLRPALPWPGHRPGQFMRLGVEINGIRHWRAYAASPRS